MLLALTAEVRAVDPLSVVSRLRSPVSQAYEVITCPLQQAFV
jgi:hypothetical protein